MRIRSIFALAVAVALVGLSGCKGPTTLDSQWPAAVSERTVTQPAGQPRWPLTGLDAPSPEAIRTRVVSVKIENAPAARPQTGLDRADIVYETVTEGGITRFNALYQSYTPKAVGPVRSARPSDFAIVPQFHALFAHCGGDRSVRKQLADKTRFDDMDQFFNAGPYWRSKDRSAPHNLYLDMAKLRVAAITKRGYPAAEDVKGPAFARSSNTATPTVSLLTVPFSASNKVTWRFSKSADTYARSINGKAHVDQGSGKQYTARNVVVLWAKISRYTASHNSQLHEIQLVGSGRVSVFHDGQRYDGTWEAGESSPPVLRSADGRVIALAPGKTWFQVIGNDQSIVMK